jgi:TRAP-type C4-dicarboxylate transport system permease large subunit
MEPGEHSDADRIVADLRRRAQRRVVGVWGLLAVGIPVNDVVARHGRSLGAAFVAALMYVGVAAVISAALFAVWRFRPAWLDLPAVMGADGATRRHIARVVAGTASPRGHVDEALAADSARFALRGTTAITVLPALVVVVVAVAALTSSRRAPTERIVVGVVVVLIVAALQWVSHRRRARARRFLRHAALP